MKLLNNESTEKQPKYIFKICLLGQARVGKTCIARRLCFNEFNINTKETLGLNFYRYNLPIITKNEEAFIQLSIWDFGAQEHFQDLFPYYIAGVNGLFLIFELTNPQSLKNLNWWYQKLIQYGHSTIPMILVGTKNDLIENSLEKNIVDVKVINKFSKKYGELPFIRTSSKENYNILKSVKNLALLMLDHYNLLR